MEEKMIDSMDDEALTPADYITLMFERTDEDGILYIPGWPYDMETEAHNSYRCKMDWNLFKYEKVLKEFNTIFAAIEKIAESYDEIEETPGNAKSILVDNALFEMWNTYLRRLDNGGFDWKKVDGIGDKMDTVEWVRDIAARVAKDERITDYEKETLTEYIDVTVTKEEEKYHRNYVSHIYREAEKRLGDNICAYDVCIRARRVYRLFSLKAPKIVIDNEARILAAALVLHEYGISKEEVDNNIRIRLAKMELMSEEELDELYRPQKTNTRKSMAPLFVYEILRKKSDSKTHLRQQDILKELEKYPYEITLERKALSRIIHNLIDTPHYAVFSDKTGVWVEQE